MGKEILIGVYAITNTVDGKMYIGSSTQIYQRWWNHRTTLRRNDNHAFHLQVAFNEYGEKYFEFKILETVSDVSILKEREQYWMDIYNSYEREYGYNTNPKSKDWTGSKHRPETIEKLRLAKSNMSDETKKKISEGCMGRTSSFKGKHHSDEAKELMRMKKIGKSLSEEHKAKIRESCQGINLGNSNGMWKDK